MMRDVFTVMWKESREIFAMGGAYRGRLQLVVLLGMMGVVLPLQAGADWITSPATIGVWGWLPVVLVSTIIADSFAGERERHTLETLLASRLGDSSILVGKMAAAVTYGWSVAIAGLVLALVTVNVAGGTPGIVLYPTRSLLAAVSLSFLAALLASAAGVLVSLRAETVRQAQQTLGVATMLILFVPLFGFRGLPEPTRVRLGAWIVRTGAARIVLMVLAALTVIDVALVLAARARFRRAKLAV
jgi:ABC-2 type transport system permease protein